MGHFLVSAAERILRCRSATTETQIGPSGGNRHVVLDDGTGSSSGNLCFEAMLETAAKWQNGDWRRRFLAALIIRAV